MKILTDCYAQTEVEEMESYNHINLSGCSPKNTMLLDNHNLTELNSGSFASNIPWPEMPRLLYPTNRPSPLAELPIPPDSLVITEDSPLERWYSSSSEDEGCTIKALATVASSLLPPELHATRADISSGSSLGSARSIGSHQSLSSRRKQRYLFRTTTTAALAIDTDTIQPKEEEQEPNPFNGPSKGKAKAKAKHKTAPSGPKEQKKYQCTFCTATFTTKGNWNRHEASVHLLSDTWICAPDGPWDKKKNGA
ncbi:Similar to hypothetical protein TRIATDRAFT_161626, partial [Trichoderma atroviride IMI 206040]; acc. no. EHK43495 [Pyronema omphalodes CBS 100304]|uniref:C2H2-type domain-containing protein n=1 Tax=Pyronema omphalodes (strain CBS 100304) TaxID=1076935 RepID=U4LCL0_PYROM